MTTRVITSAYRLRYPASTIVKFEALLLFRTDIATHILVLDPPYSIAVNLTHVLVLHIEVARITIRIVIRRAFIHVLADQEMEVDGIVSPHHSVLGAFLEGAAKVARWKRCRERRSARCTGVIGVLFEAGGEEILIVMRCAGKRIGGS